jgi:hypothetical protein
MSSSGEWIWAIGIAGAWGLLEYFAGTLWRKRKEVRAQNWPVSYGRITKAAVFHGKHEITLTLSYYYPVADEPYPIPAEFQKEFYSGEQAQAWADALSDQMIPVRVNPANSWKSVLMDSELENIVRANAAKLSE